MDEIQEVVKHHHIPAPDFMSTNQNWPPFANHLQLFPVKLGCPNMHLEDRGPAEFSSNMPQHTSLEDSDHAEDLD